MRGDDVREVQRVLARWYNLGPAWADGVYGPGTAEQVRRAQRGVPPEPKLDADGVVGPMTRRKLGLPT
jgi:peptidoglycan hydrolase-like protein with peptidoglycan-binding domain